MPKYMVHSECCNKRCATLNLECIKQLRIMKYIYIKLKLYNTRHTGTMCVYQAHAASRN